MNALFQQILLWLLVSASLGVIAGWLLAKLYTKTSPVDPQPLARCQQQAKQQQRTLQQTQDELNQYKQQLASVEKNPTTTDADCQAYQQKIAKLEQALLDVLKNRH